ncbi:hypothetical protein NQ317_001072 [Molorchus minor]|uniref:MADF domain-containing protein n=1 Tax=Molorchus minor TaxID=1323400 RepID=A0ABQ9JQL9_9CUCU|nr:hypothetical protein NQ317_001072 [Molorchus minor]
MYVVLLSTRNCLEFLRNNVDSVKDKDYVDSECDSDSSMDTSDELSFADHCITNIHFPDYKKTKLLYNQRKGKRLDLLEALEINLVHFCDSLRMVKYVKKLWCITQEKTDINRTGNKKIVLQDCEKDFVENHGRRHKSSSFKNSKIFGIKNKLSHNSAAVKLKSAAYQTLKIWTDECKQRWESLRSQYRKICKIRETKTGQAATKRKKWRYEDEMSFLLPYIKDKQRLSSLDPDTAYNDSDTNGEELQGKDSQHKNDFENDEAERNTSQNIPIGTPLSDTPPSTSRIKATPRKRIRHPPDTASGTLMKYIISQKQQETENPKKDHIDLVFDSITATLHIKLFDCVVLQQMAGLFEVVSEDDEEIAYSDTDPQRRLHVIGIIMILDQGRWALQQISYLEININKYSPMRGFIIRRAASVCSKKEGSGEC